jgi:signal transduction histidine kinase
VREEERTRIAREIHDELGQALTGLKLDLAWLRPRLKDRPELTERLQSIVVRIDGTIDSVRRIATELRPSVLDHLGLVAAVEWQAQEFSERTGIAAAVRLTASTMVLVPETATTVFRILQEALTNVARHAGATRVEIALDLSIEAVRLEVQDNGRGIDLSARAGARSLGLLGMQERAGACGGELTIDSRPGAGTVLTLYIPRVSGRDAVR